jgi:hypothetical protein
MGGGDLAGQRPMGVKWEASRATAAVGSTDGRLTLGGALAVGDGQGAVGADEGDQGDVGG